MAPCLIIWIVAWVLYVWGINLLPDTWFCKFSPISQVAFSFCCFLGCTEAFPCFLLGILQCQILHSNL